ncbi:MAG: Abortive infection protein [Candidatus Falkowbacteria bacterium GW2011_GWC2_38_22]|uniref:Abortive infection protein n=1 Tax=Candidatus Falkowbacteria bacterium GW2011_GWE1_38_31 TaxID=1618638 RepID=A0A0G0JV95_9BACT|nr:MAG: Abortive infection protein [Candidatus Falkowbacteria bacterium GW2011_GWF2_38_1205]KKQ61711.1 MAG: Abortive infection protein [Candidatus Falkowbacteria bacterium GW2011_GWC2_38_22]KKQ63674.1 MAG: Abortive infection protein [Candidatus Falkowbacteria bacterium GW2011_GWF1_38_22]KKQ65910.1 MAG: Abortive infection protein [Candidatus Falkowbacteria bacterium GW2011_GWE2_38_254]KKQ70537.1 MAG: Abortive infection protein [Candidatus Falkowbacteria bacterium GW2011_GWE1_38_31]KKQ72933.1 MA
MKHAINWKLFFILLLSSVITTWMVLPYALMLLPKPTPAITPLILLATTIQSLVMFSIVIFFGLFLAKRIGFGLPILEGLLKGERPSARFKSILAPSIGWGVLAGVLIVLCSLPFGSMSLDFLKTEMTVQIWKSFLASFYGGIAEELLLRLFLMTLFVWITFKIKKTADNKPTVIGIWLAIIISSIIFGLGHLPITSGITAITPVVVIRAVVLNGIGGIIFGYLYWKRGLESAMISHFSADICLHVITPLIGAVFM